VAQAYYELGELHEAEEWAARAAELGAREDAVTQMLWRQIRAKVLAQRGEHADAERLAREAVQIGAVAETLNSQAETYADLGEVLALADRPEEAAEAFEEALERFERKENLVMADRMRERLGSYRS
jgi:tetratricopeptide (TPR) repeat protein